MASLTCDICGGRLKMRKGKTAVCESCGMEHSVERVREKIQEVKGTVHVDSAHLIENFLQIAKDAYSTGNYAEAERYCNKVLENDASHVEASVIKGKAIGGQSNLSNFRFREVAICFANAVNSADDDLKESINNDVQEGFRKFVIDLITTRCVRFVKWPDDEESKGFCNDLQEISESISWYIIESGMTIDRNRVFSDVGQMVSLTINAALMTKIGPEYKNDSSRSAYRTFVERIDYCALILEKTADLCDNDDSSDVKIYEVIISMLETVIRCNSSDLIEDKWGVFKNIPRLSNYEVESKQSKINELKNKVSKIKRGY